MQAFHHDLYRALNKGRWWVMEQQPGPVNWAPYNPAPLPGMVRLWTWEAFAHGAEVVSYFRWRQAPFAQEQMHAGLRRPDDQPAPGLEEAARVAQELTAMPEVSAPQAPVALIFDYASHMAWEVLPQGADFSYFRLMLDTYRALRRRGLSVDILPPSTTDLTGYKMVLAPGLAVMPPALSDAMQKQPVSLTGPRSNLVTDELSIPQPMGPNLPGFDVTVTKVESLPPGTMRTVFGGGAVVHWIETLEGSAEVRVSTDQGEPLIVAEGTHYYLGGWPDATLWDRILTCFAKEADLPLQNLPDGLRLRDTATHRFAFNYSSEPIVWEGQTIAPADLAYRAL